jgi:glutamate/aspartate transport system substrate-binding protein
MKLLKLISGLVSVGVIAASVQAAEPTGTLKKIKDSGTITLGVTDASVPFAYLNEKQQHVGYAVDLCMEIVAAVKKELGLATLNVAYNPVVSATRIPLLVNGTVDLVCSSAANNAERQKQVAFAPTTFVASSLLLSKKTSNIKSLPDLKGKSVVSTLGTTEMKQLSVLNNEQNLGMHIMPAKDHAEGFLMVETGRAAAFNMSDILLAGQVANSKSPADYVISKDPLFVEPYGIMLRRDDPLFKKLADGAIINTFKTGAIDKIYAKWFTSPIPPKGINLNWTMTEQLKAAIAKPTDSPDPAHYVAAAAK